jgi:hypothetical protein
MLQTKSLINLLWIYSKDARERLLMMMMNWTSLENKNKSGQGSVDIVKCEMLLE